MIASPKIMLRSGILWSRQDHRFREWEAHASPRCCKSELQVTHRRLLPLRRLCLNLQALHLRGCAWSACSSRTRNATVECKKPDRRGVRRPDDSRPSGRHGWRMYCSLFRCYSTELVELLLLLRAEAAPPAPARSITTAGVAATGIGGPDGGLASPSAGSLPATVTGATPQT